MKKKCFAALIAALMCCTGTVSVNAAAKPDTEQVAYVSGDVNGDGEFGISDVITLQRWLLAVPDTQLVNWKAADLCADGRLDVFDLAVMKSALLETMNGVNDEELISIGFAGQKDSAAMTSMRLALKCRSFCPAGETLSVDAYLGDISIYEGDHMFYDYSVFASNPVNYSNINDSRLVVNGEQSGSYKLFPEDEWGSFEIKGFEQEYDHYHHETSVIDLSNYSAGSSGCIQFRFLLQNGDIENPQHIGAVQLLYFYVGENGAGVSVKSAEDAEAVYNNSAAESVMAYDSAFIKWNGKIVSSELYDLLQKSGNNITAVTPMFRLNEDFIYKGRAMKDYLVDDENDFKKKLKLEQIIKMGDSLKYGEALYTTGTPDGERWVKAFYDDRVEYFGEDFLDTYIVDGEFLRDKAEADLADLMTHYRTAYREARDAYYVEAPKIAAAQLEEQGIWYEFNDRSELVIYVTADELAELSMDNIAEYTLTMSGCEDYTVRAENAAMDDMVVTG